MAKTQIVGIINITPDSFSDGGNCYKADTALHAIGQYIEEGVDIIDIGAESTRPGATPLSPEDEWQRLEPVLAALPLFTLTPAHFSIDTRHALTAQRALDAGAHWINDVSGFADPAMVEVVKSFDCKLVVMHSLSVPADKSIMMPESVDVMQALVEFANERVAALQSAGIARERIIFDPGIGFGKTTEQSLAIMRHIKKMDVLGVPILIGHSRKSFLAQFGERDEATLAVSNYLAQQGVDYLRVHDVARHRRMLNILEVLSHD